MKSYYFVLLPHPLAHAHPEFQTPPPQLFLLPIRQILAYIRIRSCIRCIFILKRTEILSGDLVIAHHFQGNKMIQLIGRHLVRYIFDRSTCQPCDTCFCSDLQQLLCNLTTTWGSDSTTFRNNLQEVILNSDVIN